MYRGNLPGFWWDEPSRKYHKIIPRSQEHHHPGYKYSESNVSKWHHDAKKRKREENRQKKLKASTIQRAKALTKPSRNSLTIKSELGFDKPARIMQDRIRAFIGGLEQHKSFDMLPTCVRPEDKDRVIDGFDYDRESGALVLGTAHLDSPRYSTYTIMPTWRHKACDNDDATVGDLQTRQRMPKYLFTDLCDVEPCPSQLAYIALDSSTRLFVWATTGSTEHPSINITYLLDSEEALRGEDLDCSCTNKFTLSDVGSIFCGANNPSATDQDLQYLAIGTSATKTGLNPRGIIIMDNMSGITKWKISYQVAIYSDVVALDWLSSDVLIAGCRDGCIILHDVRTRDSVKRMKHSTGILDVKRANNSHTFVVIGTNNRLIVYDLKTLRVQDAAKHMKTHAASITPARWITMSNINNILCERFGLDVCYDLGLVAYREHNGTIRIISLQGTKTIKMLNISGISQDDKDKYSIKCLRWVKNPYGVIKLMAAFGPYIWEYVW